LTSCTPSSIESPSIHAVNYLGIIDELHPKIQLSGYFSTESLSSPKEVICHLESKTEKTSFQGTLLPGGQICILFDVEKFQSFIHSDTNFSIEIEGFKGYLRINQSKNESLILKYLPETIIYDLE
jgi:hypothetical protein